jgi:hypothetical protein
LLRQSKTDPTREDILLAIDNETNLAVKKRIGLARINDGYLLRGNTNERLNQRMELAKISYIFKSLAIEANVNPK